jgi:hypothetical protein
MSLLGGVGNAGTNNKFITTAKRQSVPIPPGVITNMLVQVADVAVIPLNLDLTSVPTNNKVTVTLPNGTPYYDIEYLSGASYVALLPGLQTQITKVQAATLRIKSSAAPPNDDRTVQFRWRASIGESGSLNGVNVRTLSVASVETTLAQTGQAALSSLLTAIQSGNPAVTVSVDASSTVSLLVTSNSSTINPGQSAVLSQAQAASLAAVTASDAPGDDVGSMIVYWTEGTIIKSLRIRFDIIPDVVVPTVQTIDAPVINDSANDLSFAFDNLTDTVQVTVPAGFPLTVRYIQ